jgi:glycosyltransferase involved in cell wall biosynthesis
MKIAIVHDWLNQKVGGAESVLFELAKMYPKADIYTLVYNKKFDKYLRERVVYKSKLQKFPGFIKKRPKLLLPFIKSAVQKWDFSKYDLVITSSSAWVKNISVPKGTKHICYCHTPARMLWDSWPGYIKDMRLGPVLRFYLVKLASKLRLWDFYQAQGNIEMIANSQYIANRIKKFYHKPAKIIYPPVETEFLANNQQAKQDFYLIISILSKYKNIELAINAFKANGKKLVIAGDGPELNNLRNIAKGHKNIEFKGRVDDRMKKDLLSIAKGFVFCSIEDFGISMVESIAAGTSVIALRGGGASEIIVEGETGLFFDEPSIESLNAAINKFEKGYKNTKKIDNKYVFSKFDKKVFIKKIREVVGE